VSGGRLGYREMPRRILRRGAALQPCVSRRVLTAPAKASCEVHDPPPAAKRSFECSRPGEIESADHGRIAWLRSLLTISGAVVAVLFAVDGGPELVARADGTFFVLFACLVLGELVVVVRSLPIRLESSAGPVFAFAVLLLYGGAAAVLTMVLASILGDIARRKRVRVIAINAASWALAFAVAGTALATLAAPHDVVTGGDVGSDDLTAIASAGATLFAVHFMLVMTVVAVDAWRSVLWRQELWPAAADDTAALSVGTLIALAGAPVEALPLLLLPFVLVAGRGRLVASAECALRDPLTGLPNRSLFYDRMQQAVRRAKRDGIGGAVLLVDLDGFKQVNDSLGHQAGDALLQQVAERLAGCVRASDTVARLGGDEFALLLPGQTSPADAARYVRDKIAAALSQQFVVGGAVCAMGASVGVAAYPADGGDPAAVVASADKDMYVDKRRRKRDAHHDEVRAFPPVAVAGI
jgi:diguanylate cyclase (GGDEF)-like protein